MNNQIQMAMFTQGGRKILVGRDNESAKTVVVVRSEIGYTMHVVHDDDTDGLRLLLSRKPHRHIDVLNS